MRRTGVDLEDFWEGVDDTAVELHGKGSINDEDKKDADNDEN
jgi:hypothetical protein